jgi:hypothetical protein
MYTVHKIQIYVIYAIQRAAEKQILRFQNLKTESLQMASSSDASLFESNENLWRRILIQTYEQLA